MIYEYRCSETGKTIEKEFSIKDEIPVEIKEGKRVYKRYFGSQSIHIPFQWGDDTRRNTKFDKSPSGKKHFY